MDEEQRIEVCSRFTAHEFIIEILLCNLIASQGENSAKLFVKQFREKAKLSFTDNPPDDSDIKIAARSGELIERILVKALERIER